MNLEKITNILFSNKRKMINKNIQKILSRKNIEKLKNIDLDIQNSITKLNRQFLHAKTLGFIHPRTKKEMIFSSLLPQDLNNILKMLRNTEE